MARLLLLASLFYLNWAQATTLQDILAGHSDTLGSAAFRANIQNLTYDLHISEPTFEARAVYRATRAGQMRIDLYMEGQHVFTEAYDGKRAWQWNLGDDAPVAIDGQAAAALRHGLELPGHINTLLDLKPRGHELEYLGLSEEGRHLLKATLDDGHEKYYELDPDSYLISASRDYRAFHPDWDPDKVQVQTWYKDYKRVGEGWLKSSVQQNWDNTNDQPLGVTTVMCLELNLTVDPSVFQADSVAMVLPAPTCSS